MSRILFVSYGGGHVAALAPVARMAIKHGHDVQYLALTTARTALKDSGIPLLGIANLIDHAAPNALSYGREFTRSLPDGPVSRAESEAYLGASFADLVVERGEIEARSRYATLGRHAFLPIAFFERALKALSPDIVIATNSPRAEQACLIAAGRLGIASVCVIDLFALQEYRWCAAPGYGTHVCVLNEYVRDFLMACGRPSGEIVVTGNPAFDRLATLDAKQRGLSLRRDRGWNTDVFVILWASQVEPANHPFNDLRGDPDLPRVVEEELRSFVRTHKGYRLVVRYHPNEQIPFVAERHVEQSNASEPLDALLHAVDLVVVTASTVGLEASLIGKPVVSVDRSIFTPDVRYAEFGVSHPIKEIADLESAILELSRSAAAAPDSQVVATEGATEQVLDVIESVTNWSVA